VTQPLENWELAAGVTPAHNTIVKNWHLKPSEVLNDLKYSALNASETRKATGCDTPSVELDYDDLDGNPTGISRWRLADSTKVPFGAKPRKYTSKSGTPPALFLPRGLRRSWRYYAKHPEKTLYITEGEAKALYAALRFKIPCIAVQGCSGWQAQGIPAAQFDWFKWQDRPVIITPDSDYRKNPEIRRWFAKLGKHLASLGAKVRFRFLPDLVVDKENPDKSKTGLDDYAALLHADLAAFKTLTTLPLSDPYIQQWDRDDAGLPASLHDLSPNTAEMWINDAPEPKFLLFPYIQEKEVAQLAGQAGTSKSTWSMYMAAHLATGTQFFDIGKTISRPYRVMYCMLERHKDSFHRRWRKIARAIHDGVGDKLGPKKQFHQKLIENYTAKPLAGETFHLIEYANKQWVQTAALAELIANLKAAGIEVMFLDPLSRLHGGDEDVATMSALTKALERIVQEAGCTVIFVHHAGINSREESKYGGRGGSPLTDNTSETITFTEYKGADRNALGDLSVLRPGEEQDDIVRVLHTRCSDGATAAAAYYIRAKATGLLRPINIRRKDGSDLVLELITSNERFHTWADEFTGHLTKSALIKVKEKVFGDLSEAGVEKLISEAMKASVFRNTERKYKRGIVYEWVRPQSPEASSGAVAQATAKPLRHKKNQAQPLQNSGERKHV
jgi:AAA domain/Domain of unknown function (DUF3854)